jgi:hypothetical protein
MEQNSAKNVNDDIVSNDFIAEVKGSNVDVTVTQYPLVKRMIMTLDKFLDRRIAGVGIFYFAVLFACSVAVFSGTAANAATDGAANTRNLNIFVYSVVVIATVLFLSVVARVIAVRIARNKKTSN